MGMMRGFTRDIVISRDLPADPPFLVDISPAVHTCLTRAYVGIMTGNDWSGFAAEMEDVIRDYMKATKRLLLLVDGVRLSAKQVNSTRATDAKTALEAATAARINVNGGHGHAIRAADTPPAHAYPTFTNMYPSTVGLFASPLPPPPSAKESMKLYKKAVHGKSIDAIPIVRNLCKKLGCPFSMAATETDSQAVYDQRVQPWRAASGTDQQIVIGNDSDYYFQQFGAKHFINLPTGIMRAMAEHYDRSRVEASPPSRILNAKAMPAVDAMVDKHGWVALALVA